MNTRIHTIKKYSVLLTIILVFISCGIEEYIYLDPIPSGNIRVTANELAVISLPYSSSQSIYFRNYSIYYRIYLSTENISSDISEGNLNSIHSSLYSDYFAIKPYTNASEGDTNISPSNIDITFRNRDYNRIAVDEINIETLLNSTTDNKVLTLNFTETGDVDTPTLLLESVPYTLRRSMDEGAFDPAPDYTFKNSVEIRNSENEDFNGDVEPLENATECYVSLYIVKVGQDNNFSQIYSFPTFIGIFRLPS
jgi:hypothetical protein